MKKNTVCNEAEGRHNSGRGQAKFRKRAGTIQEEGRHNSGRGQAKFRHRQAY